MFVVVTGAAGFIGSHVSERLVADGHRVVGVDSFTPAYARELKEANLTGVADEPGFELLEADVRDPELSVALESTDALVHLAGLGGARGRDVTAYEEANVDASAALLARSTESGIGRVVLASSSSVYGRARDASAEDAPLRPASPYACSKAAAERLARSSRLAVLIIRYYTVYGPRQRPDMAFARFIEAALGGRPAPVFAGGSHVRDFTYVGDAVEGTVLALHRGLPGRPTTWPGAAR